ncbi:MAG: hypothetical protein JHC40_09695 [Burkholderiales bacterium]|jgi:hypothetical protein|nr:hypothetical protein [Burkholderiales bacterium]
MQQINDYFGAERLESLLFIMAGIVALGIAAYALLASKNALLRGAAWPLALVALIQLGVGGGVFLRSHKDIARVQSIVQVEAQRVRSEEIPRMEAVVNNFVRYRWIEIGLLVAAILLHAFGPAASAWRGAGIGLFFQAGLMLALDFFAERRAIVYLDWLRALPAA